MDWDKLKVFHTVAQAGSFTKAAERLNLSQSAVSRQVSTLEDSLSIPLFHRHVKGLMLTAQGEILFQITHEVFVKLALTEALLKESFTYPRGNLKIASSITFGSICLIPHLKDFTALYPHIRLNLTLQDTEVDLSTRAADISLSFHKPTQPDLIAMPLPVSKLRLYASRKYLEKNGVPLKISDLDAHQLLVCKHEETNTKTKENILLHAGTKKGMTREPYLITNNEYGLLQGVKADLGLAILNRYSVRDEPTLVEILPEYDFGSLQKYMIYPAQMKTSKRISAFRDFILNKTKKDAEQSLF